MKSLTKNSKTENSNYSIELKDGININNNLDNKSFKYKKEFYKNFFL